jgi:hypothetical protein
MNFTHTNTRHGGTNAWRVLDAYNPISVYQPGSLVDLPLYGNMVSIDVA